MISLKNIVDEIQVTPKKNPQDVFKTLYAFNASIIERVDNGDSLEEIQNAYGYDEDDLNKLKSLYNDYKLYIKPGDVWVFSFDEHYSPHFTSDLKKHYKYITIDWDDDSEMISVILHNWSNFKL